MANYKILTKNDLRNHYFAIGEEALKRINVNQPITLICNGKVYENRNIDKSLGYGHLYAKKEFFEDNHLEVNDCLVFDIEATNIIRITILKNDETINIDSDSDVNLEDTLKSSEKLIKHMNKKSFYIEKGRLLSILKEKIDLIEPGLKPYYGSFGQLGKSIKENSFLRYKSQDGFVLVTVDKNHEKLDRIIKQLKEAPYFENTNIRGFLIKPYDKKYDENFCDIERMSIHNSSIKVLYCKFDFRLHEKRDNSIIIRLNYLKGLDEDHVRDYFLDHLYEIENNLHPYKNDYNGCRDYKIKSRKIDLFCKDKNDKPVVVEIKKGIKNTYNSYEAVGQILCYMRLVETEETLDNVRGIILINKDATETYKKDIQLALDCCQDCREINLLYYSAELSFVE